MGERVRISVEGEKGPKTKGGGDGQQGRRQVGLGKEIGYVGGGGERKEVGKKLDFDRRQEWGNSDKGDGAGRASKQEQSGGGQGLW